MTHSNRLKVFVWTAVVFLLVGAGKCNENESSSEETSQEADGDTTIFENLWGKTGEENDISGTWYAVMSTACTDDGPCNILTNNVEPCACLSVIFLPLQNNGWQVFMSAINNGSNSLTIDMGGASAMSDDNTNIKGFILSRAEMPTSVIAVSQNFITEKVTGSGYFMRYEMSIIGHGTDFFYIVTTMKTDNNSEIIVIWSRNRRPGKATTWTQILGTLKELNINPHDLNFISQENCKYPSMEQCNEMSFCVSDVN